MSYKINLGLPAYGSTYRGEFVRSLFATLTDARQKGISYALTEIDYNDITFSRNYLLSNFFYRMTDCDHLLMIDSDMGFPPTMIPAMLELRKPVVGAIYPKRSIDLRRLHSLGGEQFEKALRKSIDFVGVDRNPLETRNGFVRVDVCGGGIMLISRGCAEQMVEKLPEIVDRVRFRKNALTKDFDGLLTPFDLLKLPDRQFSDDFAFCYRWVEQCGGEIWACYDQQVSHVGNLTVRSARGVG